MGELGKSRLQLGRFKTYEVDIRVVTGSLAGGGTVKVPLLELGDGRGLALLDGHGLTSETSLAVDPDVCKASVLIGRVVFGGESQGRVICQERMEPQPDFPFNGNPLFFMHRRRAG